MQPSADPTAFSSSPAGLPLEVSRSALGRRQRPWLARPAPAPAPEPARSEPGSVPRSVLWSGLLVALLPERPPQSSVQMTIPIHVRHDTVASGITCSRESLA